MSETEVRLWGMFAWFLGGVAFGILLDRACYYLARNRKLNGQLYPRREGEEPCWESVPAVQDREIVGYQVRWSEADTEGRYLWVSHYYAGRGPSIDWCESAAKRDAIRRNDLGTRPEGFVGEIERGSY